jgi:hypothetical protein
MLKLKPPAFALEEAKPRPTVIRPRSISFFILTGFDADFHSIFIAAKIALVAVNEALRRAKGRNE